MLGQLERVVAWLSWAAAAVFVVMLLIGPQVIAEDEPQPQATGGYNAAPDGEQIFTERCGSCHTLDAAGTSGQVGPNLTDTALAAEDVEAIVSDGRGSMPGFGGELSEAEIAAVAEFVTGSP